jgi:hypothetical protein
MSDTKEIILTGMAADSYGHKPRRRSRKNQSGSGSTQGAIVQLQSTTSSSENATAASVEGTNPSKIAAIAAPTNAPTALPLQNGGKTKVILKAPTKKAHKVILSVSKTPVVKTTNIVSNKKTRKSSKKILFSLKNLRKKLSTAKTIKKHSEEKSLEEIKKILVEAKLIKVGSKAPESMIRQIYNDYMTLKHKAL